jgi:cell division transport system permease protein
MALSLDYVVRETASNLWRNRVMALAGVLTVAISLSLVGTALLLKQGVARVDNRWRGGVDVIIFLQPDASASQTKAIAAELRSDPQVRRFSYVDQAASYREFRADFANQPALLQAVTPQELPPSYRVVLRDAAEAAVFARQFEGQPGVKQASYNGQAINTMMKVTSIAQIIMWVLAALLLVSATALVLTAIRMAIFARRREVAVMKLVGATNWFIRVPFMLEGFLQGLIGALLAAVGVWGVERVVSYVINRFRVNLFHEVVLSGGDVVKTQVLVLFLGALLGAAGSAIAVRRFLEV